MIDFSPDRRDFLASSMKTLGKITFIPSLAFLLSGCQSQMATIDERGRLYCDRKQDIADTMKRVDPGQAAINEAILKATDKFDRALQPDYFKFKDIQASRIEPLKPRKDKKTLGVIEIYCVDTARVKMLESYLTDFMISSIMANLRLGENFRIVERYRIKDLIDDESEIRKIEDFDPRDLIKKNLFKRIDCILTGTLYFSKKAHETDNQGRQIVSYKGGVEFLMRGIDVSDADIIGTATEHIDWSPAVEEWIRKAGRG